MNITPSPLLENKEFCFTIRVDLRDEDEISKWTNEYQPKSTDISKFSKQDVEKIQQAMIEKFNDFGEGSSRYEFVDKNKMKIYVQGKDLEDIYIELSDGNWADGGELVLGPRNETYSLDYQGEFLP